MLQFRKVPAFVSRWARSLRFLATDWAVPFLGDMCCPLGRKTMAVAREKVRSLASPLEWESLETILDDVERIATPSEFDDFLVWATFTYDPANAPYLVWQSYLYAFELWAGSMKRNHDRMMLHSAEPVWIEYKKRMNRKMPNDERKLFVERLKASQRCSPSKWDQLLMDLLGSHLPGDMGGWQPYLIIDQTFDMAQFQRFIVGVRDRINADDSKRIEAFVARFFSPSNPGPFLPMKELPTCCRDRRFPH